jgi:hypothetical protein
LVGDRVLCSQAIISDTCLCHVLLCSFMLFYTKLTTVLLYLGGQPTQLSTIFFCDRYNTRCYLSSFYFLHKTYASIHCNVFFTFYSLTSYHIFYCIWFSTFTVYFNFMCIYLNSFRSKSNMICRKGREITFFLNNGLDALSYIFVQILFEFLL